MDVVSTRAYPELYEASGGEAGKRYIFISYSHEDAELVYRDLSFLTQNGARVWYDKAMHVGQDWQTRARNKIFDPDCCAVLFYLSPSSLKSKAVLKELEFVRERMAQDGGSFQYMSVNIGAQKAFDMLRCLDVEETDFLEILQAFGQRKIFIARDTDPLSQSHWSELVSIFEERDAIDLTRCLLLKNKLFATEKYRDGLQITNYYGKDSIVTVPSEMYGQKVLAIGINAFQGNEHIRRVVLSEGVTLIDDFAFAHCGNLEDIVLPNSLTRIGYEAFRECGALKKITIPYHVSHIGDYAFYKCGALAQVQLLPAVPLVICFAAFSECFSIETITLPGQLREIGPYAFNNCINLVGIELPESVREIGVSAFNSCVSLRLVNMRFPLFLEYHKWFSRCGNLEAVFVPANLEAAYESGESWNPVRGILRYKLAVPSHIRLKGNTFLWDPVPGADYYMVSFGAGAYRVEQSSFTVPLPEDGAPVPFCVRACSLQERREASDMSAEVRFQVEGREWDVTEGEDGKVLRKYNGSAEVVVIPEGITEIGERAFFNRSAIREVVFPESLVRIGDSAFYHCGALSVLRFSHSLKTIGDNAFWGSSLTELTLPESLEYIGTKSFACSNSLKKITILSPRTRAGVNTFYRCIKLKKVELPEGYPRLYPRMFRGCTELSDITLPEGLEDICEGSLSYLMSLPEITIPRTVRHMENEVFASSLGLTSIWVDGENRDYYDDGGVLIHRADRRLVRYPADKALTEYTVREGVESIGYCAFTDTEHLERVILGKQVHTIEKSAFERCMKLREVIVSGDLSAIGESAFRDCTNLRSVRILGRTVPDIGERSFANVSPQLRILVPAACLRNYQRDIEWRKYQHMLDTF